jgi:hypothetical protein
MARGIVKVFLESEGGKIWFDRSHFALIKNVTKYCELSGILCDFMIIRIYSLSRMVFVAPFNQK